MTKVQDSTLLDDVTTEIGDAAMTLLEDHPLNWYNSRTARADCLRLLRAAIELAPTVPE